MGGLAAAATSLYGSLAGDGFLGNGDDWELGDLLTYGAPDTLSALRKEFDQLCVACEQAGVAKLATVANVVDVAEAVFPSQQQLPPQVALVQSEARRIAALPARCTSIDGTSIARQC